MSPSRGRGADPRAGLPLSGSTATAGFSARGPPESEQRGEEIVSGLEGLIDIVACSRGPIAHRGIDGPRDVRRAEDPAVQKPELTEGQGETRQVKGRFDRI